MTQLSMFNQNCQDLPLFSMTAEKTQIKPFIAWPTSDKFTPIALHKMGQAGRANLKAKLNDIHKMVEYGTPEYKKLARYYQAINEAESLALNYGF